MLVSHYLVAHTSDFDLFLIRSVVCFDWEAVTNMMLYTFAYHSVSDTNKCTEIQFSSAVCCFVISFRPNCTSSIKIGGYSWSLLPEFLLLYI